MRDNFKSIVKSTARVIRKNGRMTRREIADILPVSIMTVGKAVDFLCELGIVSETVPHTPGTGRKAGLLSLSERYCVVIDVSRRNFTLDIFDVCGKKISALTHRYSDTALFEENLYIFFDRVKAFCTEKLRDVVLIGGGMIVPGRYDPIADKVEMAGSMDFVGVNPSALLSGAFSDVPTLVTDAISMGAAWAAECFPQYENAIYLKADEPLGATIVTGGRPWRGAVCGIGFPSGADSDKLYAYMTYIEKARFIARAIAGYMTVFCPDAVIIERSDGSADDGMAETVASLLTTEFSVKADLCPRVMCFSSEDGGKKNGVLSRIFENFLDETVK